MTNRNPEPRAGPLEYESPQFEVSIRSENARTLVVEVRGELDLATGPVLHQHLTPYGNQIANGRRRRIVYQLSGLTFIDCTGLTALLNAVDGHSPDTITVRDPSPPVRRVLELVGMGSMVEEADQ